MRKGVLVTVTLTAWMTAGLSAQAPSVVRPEGAGTTALAEPSVHLEGCLYGRASANQPSTEASGYVVEDVKVISQRDGGAEMPTRFTIRASADTQGRLKAFAGKRVGVTGRVGTDTNPLELQVTAIREIVGQCARRAA